MVGRLAEAEFSSSVDGVRDEAGEGLDELELAREFVLEAALECEGGMEGEPEPEAEGWG